jgi:hypothetical protein
MAYVRPQNPTPLSSAEKDSLLIETMAAALSNRPQNVISPEMF